MSYKRENKKEEAAQHAVACLEKDVSYLSKKIEKIKKNIQALKNKELGKLECITLERDYI